MGTVEEQVLGMGCKGSPVATLSLKGPLHIQAEMSSWRLELVEEPRRVVRGHVDYLKCLLQTENGRGSRGESWGPPALNRSAEVSELAKETERVEGKKWESMRSSKGKIQGERC